jgi:hypothetical protein
MWRRSGHRRIFGARERRSVGPIVDGLFEQPPADRGTFLVILLDPISSQHVGQVNDPGHKL